MVTPPTKLQVTNWFLYGSETTPDNLLNPDLVRPDSANKQNSIPVDVNWYMTAGPGRFATGNQFGIVHSFFQSSIFGGFANKLASKEYTKAELALALGLVQNGQQLSFNQVFCNDSSETQDQYSERAYIWGSTGFYINDTARFVVKIEPDGSQTRTIENFSVLPYNVPPGGTAEAGKLGPDKFNFEGGTYEADTAGSKEPTKGDMSRIKEWMRSTHDDPLPVGLFIPFDKAWLAVKEFIKTEGQLPTSLACIKNADLPENTFPDP